MLCERCQATCTAQHLPPCTCGKHRIEEPPKNKSVRSDLRIAARYLSGQLERPWCLLTTPPPALLVHEPAPTTRPSLYHSPSPTHPCFPCLTLCRASSLV